MFEYKFYLLWKQTTIIKRVKEHAHIVRLSCLSSTHQIVLIFPFSSRWKGFCVRVRQFLSNTDIFVVCLIHLPDYLGFTI